MQMTSAEAAKLLRKMNDERDAIIKLEGKSMTFVATLGEDPETERPQYDYKNTQRQLEEINKRIRKLKHALNLFNATTIVPGFDMTIDEMLVYMPQLTQQKAKLESMRDRLPKERAINHFGNGNIVDFVYTNYNSDVVKNDYAIVADQLASAQLALDQVNTSSTFEVTL